MSPALSTFLADWHNWATSGAPEGDVYEGGFSRRFGLCFHSRRRSEGISEELEDLFIEEFGDACDMPFNSERDYFEESDLCLVHTNPKRLAWVRKKLMEDL